MTTGPGGEVLRASLLGGLVVTLEPGEWYERYEAPASTRKTIRLVGADRIEARPVRKHGRPPEIWVSGHKVECGTQPSHRTCVGEYVAEAAVERAVVTREAK